MWQGAFGRLQRQPRQQQIQTVVETKLKRVRGNFDGQVKRLLVCTDCIHSGRVKKVA